jgi:hypothetical protein
MRIVNSRSRNGDEDSIATGVVVGAGDIDSRRAVAGFAATVE